MPHLTLMQWDFKDQLQRDLAAGECNDGTPETTYYVYDAGGQRVRKVTERQNGTRKDERIYSAASRSTASTTATARRHAGARDAARHGRQAAHRAGGDADTQGD